MPVGGATANAIDGSVANSLSENQRHTTKLMYACQQGDYEKVKELIKIKSNLLQRQDRTLKTALHYCAGRERQTTHCADLLVMADPSLVESRDEDGFTPLHLAVISGNVQLVHFLLANGSDVNALDSERHSVVHWATVCGEAASLVAVLSTGAEVSTPDVHGGYPLHYAAQMCGSERDQLGLQVLHILISQSNIDISVSDNDGRQPLLWAASAGSAKAVLALVRAGAMVEAPDKDGLTALHCAASRGHTDCLDTLLTLCGAQTDVIDTNGCTALHYSVTLGHADATALLLSHGSDPNRQDRKGRSPAHCGCAKGQFETVKLLGQHNANLWLRNARGDLPLHEAAASGRRDLIKWLLDQRPSQVNARNNDGRCPLHLAALNDNSDMCKILLDAGAYVNPVLRTSKNLLMTPLDCAMTRGFRSTAKFLQLHGGVPATRLSSLRSSSEITTNITIGSNFQIREDITVLGGSSTESDIDEKKGMKPRRRSIRRKVIAKVGIRKESGSENDIQEPKENKKENKMSDEETKSKDEYQMEEDEMKSERPGKMQRPKSAKRKDFAKRKSAELSEPRTHEGKVVSGRDHDNGQNNLMKDSKGEENVKTMVVEAAIHLPPKDKERENEIQREGNNGDSVIKEDDEHKKVEAQYDSSCQPKSPKADDKKTEQPKTKDEEKKTDNTEFSLKTQEKNIDKSKAIPKVDKEEITKIESLPETIKPLPKTEQKHSSLSARLKNGDSTPTSKPGTPKSNQGTPKDTPFTSEDTLSTLLNKTPPATPKTIEIKRVEIIAESIQFDAGKTSDDYKTESDVGVQTLNEIKSETDFEKPKAIATKFGPSEGLISKTNSSAITAIIGEVFTKDDLTTSNTEDLTVDEGKKSSTGELNIDLSLKKLEESAEESTATETQIRTENLRSKKKRLKPVENTTETDNMSPDKEYFEPSEHSSSETEIKQSGEPSFQVLDDKVPFRVIGSKSIVESKHRNRRFAKKHLLELESSPDLLEIRSHSVNNEKQRIVSSCDTHSMTLPVLSDKGRSDSNLSAPHLSSIFSDNEQKSDSNSEELDVVSSASRKKKFKRRKSRLGTKSAGSDYESSVLMDSGFEPSPRSSRIPKRKVMSERGVNMTSVTQSIQSNIRRYHMERKIFQHLLELKRLQIRSGQANEAVLVKRSIDAYHNSIAATVGAGRYTKKDYTYKSFEQFLYHSLRMLQRGIHEHLKEMPEGHNNPLLCTQSTHRCLHATHAYTGIPCAAYISKGNHHTMPKIGFTSAKSSHSFLPQIHTKGKGVTLELCHGNDKQVISLPADRLDQNKKYYVTFTVKGQEAQSSEQGSTSHRHAKSV